MILYANFRQQEFNDVVNQLETEEMRLRKGEISFQVEA